MKHRLIMGLSALLMISAFLSLSIRAVTAEDSALTDSIPDVEQTTDVTRGERPLVYVVTIDGAIGAVTDDRFEEAIELAEDNGAEMLVIKLDTPGGFTKPTWSICKRILNSQVPVCMFIAPSGARAGSAGVYMTYASHFAAMAPSTNIGAAHPVGGGGEEIDSVMNEKVTNDAVAQIKAAAQKWGRNEEWAERAVRESVSITDQEALELNVIDFRAEDLEDLYAQIDGKETEVPLGTKIMSLKDVRTEDIEITFIQTLLEIITSPDIAFILFSIGGLGIVLELYNPGSIFPGVVGAISLILAFYAFQTLPINYAGVSLIILALLLFIAEIKIVSHGLLTVGGIISLFLGGLMLIDTVDPVLQVSKSVLVTVAGVVGICVAAVIYLVVRANRSRPFIGNEGMIGKVAEVRSNGMVYVDGALWKAVSDEPLEAGTQVLIESVDKLTLKVSKPKI